MAPCRATICQQVTLSGDAEWPKVADTVIEADDFVQIPHNANLDPGTSSFSLDAWVKTTKATGSQVVVSKYECGGFCLGCISTSYYALVVSNGKARASLRDADPSCEDAQSLTGNTFIADGIFHHIAMVRDMASGHLRLYVDGTLDATAALTPISNGAITDNDGEPDSLIIGAHIIGGLTTADLFFSGLIDEVDFVNRALSAAEILAIFNAGSAGKCRCEGQVQVRSFDAFSRSKLTSAVMSNKLLLATFSEDARSPGIDFLAQVSIKEGLIPIDKIRIRYIQNVTAWTGTVNYNSNPDLVAAFKGTPPPIPPLLDRADPLRFPNPPPPFYNGAFEETNPQGSVRAVTADDSPLISVPITLTDPARQLQSVDARMDFTMFLGCITDMDPTFRTLSTLNWTAQFSGTFKLPDKFKQRSKPAVAAQPSVLGRRSPVQSGPIFNDVLTFVESSP